MCVLCCMRVALCCVVLCCVVLCCVVLCCVVLCCVVLCCVVLCCVVVLSSSSLSSLSATAPARIDLAGGWSDTPPITFEAPPIGDRAVHSSDSSALQGLVRHALCDDVLCSAVLC
jgi:hypothetical protein